MFLMDFNAKTLSESFKPLTMQVNLKKNIYIYLWVFLRSRKKDLSSLLLDHIIFKFNLIYEIVFVVTYLQKNQRYIRCMKLFFYWCNHWSDYRLLSVWLLPVITVASCGFMCLTRIVENQQPIIDQYCFLQTSH